MPALGGEGSWWRRERQGVRGGDVFTWRHCEFIRPLGGILWPVFGYSDLKLKERMGLKKDQDLAEDPHNHLAETLPPGCTTELLFSMSKTTHVSPSGEKPTRTLLICSCACSSTQVFTPDTWMCPSLHLPH